jgi:hypothetical protein
MEELMQRKTFYAALAALLVAGLVTAYLAAKPSTKQATVTLLYPKELKDTLLWPTNKSWIWSIKGLDSSKGTTLSLVARVVHERPLQPGESPAIGPRLISKAESETRLHTGKMTGAKLPDSVIACVQLIDLREALVQAGTEKQPLRLLFYLGTDSMGVGTWTSEKFVIEGDRYLGMAPNIDAGWKDGELHLQNLFVLEGDRQAIYDVVLVQSE